jgi:CubicO group peptidase (beta-lactamase class C family)
MKLTITIGLPLIAHLTFGQDRIQKIDSLLNSLYSKEKINGNVLIAEKGKVIYSHSFGLANETTKEKLNENSIFELASCSKQFTAMGIMILKEKGKLNLDDDITKYLPELSFYKGVTVKNLLNHTGGLPDYMQLMDSLFDKSKIATNKDIINIFSKHQPKILFEPNTKWEYSNTGYTLLASIIEKASGMTYADYLNKAIFQPLKMKNTFAYNRRLSPKKIDNYAFGYVYSDSLKKYVLPDELEETKIVIWLDGVVGDGGVNSTVNDLLIWDRALYSNKLLTKEDMKAVFELATLKDGAKRNYGFGWGIEENADFGKIANHDGGWPGYVTFIDRHITNDKTIIILQNHSNVSIPSKAIRSILYNKPLPVQKIRKEISITPEELQKFVGTYAVENEYEIKISLDKDQLFSQLTGQDAFRIFVESEMSFFYKVVDAQIQFEKNEKGEISNLFLLQNGKKIEAKRMK